jgi:acyl carrier protein
MNTKETILSRVGRIIGETFGDDLLAVTPETIAEDVPGWDSLSHTILMLALEDEFGITLPSETQGFENVGQLVDVIDRLSQA